MSNNGLFGMPNPANKNGKKDTVTYSNLDKDFVLSPSEMGRTIRINTPNNYRVKLPDARQLTKDLIVMVCNLSSTQAIDVIDNAGGIIKTCPPLQSVICWNTSKTTVAGVWTSQVMGAGNLLGIAIGTAQPLISSATTNGSHKLVGISATKAVLFYVTGGSLYAVVLNVSGSTVTVGTPTSLGASSVNYVSDAVMTSYSSTSNCCFIVSIDDSIGNRLVEAIIQNNDNIIASTVFTTAFGGSSNTKILAYSGTYIYLLGYIASVPTLKSYTIVQGVSITLSANLTGFLTAPGNYRVAIAHVNQASDVYICAYAGTSGNAYACPVFNGVRATAEFAITGDVNTAFGGTLIRLSNTSAILFSTGNATNVGSATILTISGTGASATLSQSTVYTFGLAISGGTGGQEMSVQQIDSSTYVMSYINSTGYPTQTLITLSGTVFTVVSTTVDQSVVSSRGSACLLPNSRKAISSNHITSNDFISSNVLTNY